MKNQEMPPYISGNEKKRKIIETGIGSTKMPSTPEEIHWTDLVGKGYSYHSTPSTTF
jgi:hypothetical protein